LTVRFAGLSTKKLGDQPTKIVVCGTKVTLRLAVFCQFEEYLTKRYKYSNLEYREDHIYRYKSHRSHGTELSLVQQYESAHVFVVVSSSP
jgi:hypothetical protein